MVKLRRVKVVEPKGWQTKIARRIPNLAGLQKKAKAFERLKIDGKTRQAGFKTYAAAAFASCGGDFPAVWRRSKALKKALERMTDGHCAYCQKGTEEGQVEHVRPKSLFPTLAYEVKNYLHACPRCNLAKSNKWPARGSYLRPDRTDPAGRLVFHDDGRVEAAPNDRRAARTVADIQLDRHGLRKLRRGHIERALSGLVQALNLPGLPVGVLQQFARGQLVPALSPYSEAVNQSVRRAWAARFPGVPL